MYSWDDDDEDEFWEDLDDFLDEYNNSGSDSPYKSGSIDALNYGFEAEEHEANLRKSLEDLEKELVPHYNAVKKLYDEGHDALAAVTLSPFFEAYVSDLLIENTSHSIKEEIEGDRYVSFEDKLNVANSEGLLKDKEFELVDNLRNVRSALIHKKEFFNPKTEDNGISKRKQQASNIIDKSIELYEQIIGVEVSKTDPATSYYQSTHYDLSLDLDDLYSLQDSDQEKCDISDKDVDETNQRIYEIVKQTHDLGLDGVSSIILNNYFENTLRDHLEENVLESAAPDLSIDKHIDQTEDVLDVSLYFGLIDETDYSFMQKVSDIRKEYSHDLEAFANNDVELSNEEIKYGLGFLEEHNGIGWKSRNPPVVKPDMKYEHEESSKIEPSESFSMEDWREMREFFSKHLDSQLQRNESCVNKFAPLQMPFDLKLNLARHLVLEDTEFAMLSNPRHEWDRLTDFYEELT